MSEYLLIHYIPGQQDDLQYWALGGDSHPSITLGHGKLEELAPIAKGKKVSLIIDSHYTTFKSVSIPSKNKSKQIQAVPFAMEDYLAEDIEDIHFALGKPFTSNEQENLIPVIAINKQLLRNTLELFAEHNIHISSMTTDDTLLACENNSWSILLNENTAIIKCAELESHNYDIDNLDIILAALIEQAEVKPESITCYHRDDLQTIEELFSTAEIPCTYSTFKNHPLEIFVSSINKINSLDLLQGEFTPERESSIGWLQPWKYVAAISGVWVCLYLVYASILSHQLEAKNLELSKKIETEFKRALPEAKKMTNMQKRVERRLKELKSPGSSNSKSSFLKILSEAVPALSENNKVNIRATVFRNNHVDIDLSANSLQDIEQVKNKLLKLNNIKTVLSTTVEKDKVKGRLRLEAKG